MHGIVKLDVSVNSAFETIEYSLIFLIFNFDLFACGICEDVVTYSKNYLVWCILVSGKPALWFLRRLIM